MFTSHNLTLYLALQMYISTTCFFTSLSYLFRFPPRQKQTSILLHPPVRQRSLMSTKTYLTEEFETKKTNQMAWQGKKPTACSTFSLFFHVTAAAFSFSFTLLLILSHTQCSSLHPSPEVPTRNLKNTREVKGKLPRDYGCKLTLWL